MPAFCRVCGVVVSYFNVCAPLWRAHPAEVASACSPTFALFFTDQLRSSDRWGANWQLALYNRPAVVDAVVAFWQ
eukprot:6211853-Pleurochrysis_carterae.AAC.2